MKRFDFRFRCTAGTKKKILRAEVIDEVRMYNCAWEESVDSHREIYNVKLSADMIVRIGWEICRRHFIN